MPPFADLFVPFANVCEIEAKRRVPPLEWKNVGADLLFRPHGAWPTIVWFYENAHHRLASGQGHLWLKEHLPVVYKQCDFKRIVPLPAQDLNAVPDFWLAFTRNEAILMGKDFKPGASWNAHFSWSGDALSFLSAPLAYFHDNITHHIEERPDEWEEALQWAQWNDEQRFWSLVAWKHGGALEWKALLQALLKLQSHQQKARGKRYYWQWNIEIAKSSRNATTASLNVLHDGNRISKNNSVLGQMLVLVQEHFEPQIQLQRSRLPAKAPLRHALSGGSIRADNESLSQHDLMDNIQLWRDFGRESGQLPQVEACLQQLLT